MTPKLTKLKYSPKPILHRIVKGIDIFQHLIHKQKPKNMNFYQKFSLGILAYKTETFFLLNKG